jgi:translocation and assembly module TamA
MILATLQERSYAFATVEAKAEVRPSDKQVDVTVTADLGPSCKFGKVTISHLGSPDLVRVPDELIRNELDVKDGQPYRASSLAKTQRRLFGLGVFSVVNVIPDLENAEGAVVPVRIELARSKYRQIKVGTGILLESGKQDVHVSGDFQHVNLFNKLVRLDFENTLGYTTLVQLDQVTEDGIEEVLSTSGPTVLSTLSFSVPGVPTRGWRVGNDLSFEMGVEQGYRYASQEVSPNITAQLSKKISVSASYHFQLFQYIDLQLSEDEFRKTPLGLDFREKYVLTWLGQTFTYDSRNDPMVPTRGRYGIYEIAEAGTWTGGDFNFMRLRMDQRAYWSLVSFLPRGMRGALAIRGGGGLAHPYGEETAASVPYRERLYLGGSGDVRGWVRNHLGPYICDPEAGVDCIGTPGNTQGGDTILPIGGLVSLFGSLETRFYFVGDYGFVLFLDAGNAWADLDGVWDPSQSGLPIHLLPSTGLGARYISPIGAIRFDLARRLDQEPMYALEPRWGVHFSLSEAF